MDKQIFKVGDRVFDALYGWGEVDRFYEFNDNYPIEVYFYKGERKSYTWDGRLIRNAKPTLSFTEYTLEGFSQERQIKFPCTGMLGESVFGICFGTGNQGSFICEQGNQWNTFQPMTLEEYCKLKNINL